MRGTREQIESIIYKSPCLSILMQKRWGIYNLLAGLFLLVITVPFVSSADIAGIIYGLEQSEVVKVSLVNNNNDY